MKDEAASIYGPNQMVGTENTGNPSQLGNLVTAPAIVSTDNKDGVVAFGIDPADGSLQPQSSGQGTAPLR